MEWIADPAVWVGLVTLVALEIVVIGDTVEWEGWKLEVAAMDGLGIKQLVARRAGTAGTA